MRAWVGGRRAHLNPSEFDMENCMRINLKPDYEAPPPEFRKQGHHMLEIIAAQIKEMEDAGWIFRAYLATFWAGRAHNTLC